MHDFQEVRNTESITEVSIDALDRINCFALSGFYRNILKTRPDIRIDTHTRHSKEIYRMMENRQLDLGLVSSLLPVHNLIITPLYYEIMFVVSSAESQLPKLSDRKILILQRKSIPDGRMKLKSGTIRSGREENTGSMSEPHR